MKLGDPHTPQELITLVCWYNLKYIPLYKFSRAHKVNVAGFILEWAVEYCPHYQKAYLPACVSVQHTPLLLASNQCLHG